MTERTESLVDQMEAIRARNNVTWMDLVRLALRVAPEEAKELIGQIEENDAAVTRLLKEIADS